MLKFLENISKEINELISESIFGGNLGRNYENLQILFKEIHERCRNSCMQMMQESPE